MKFQPDRAEGVNLIHGYDGTGVQVLGQRYVGRLVVPWRGPVVAWEPAQTIELAPEHFQTLLSWQPEVVLLGAVASAPRVHPRLYAALMAAGVGLEAMDRAAACRTYNVLASEGRRVLAALLPEPAPAGTGL